MVKSAVSVNGVNGVRRPHREGGRSEITPATGWTIMAQNAPMVATSARFATLPASSYCPTCTASSSPGTEPQITKITKITK